MQPGNDSGGTVFTGSTSSGPLDYVGFCFLLSGSVGFCLIQLIVWFCKFPSGSAISVRFYKFLSGSVGFCHVLMGSVSFCWVLLVSFGFCYFVIF